MCRSNICRRDFRVHLKTWDKTQGAQRLLQGPRDTQPPSPASLPFLGWGHTGLLAIPATRQGTPNPRAFALTVPSPGSTLPQAPSWAGPLTSFRGGLS